MKKQSVDWFPKARPQQLVMFTNIKAKIGGYAATLPLAAAKVTRIELICDTFIAVYNFVEQARATMQNVTEWRDLIFTAEGGTPGAIAPKAPAFNGVVLPDGAFAGIFQEFRRLRDDIVHADNYTPGIGEDLMIVAPEGDDLNPDELAASVKLTTLPGYKVRAEGSLQGMDAMRFDYQRKGASGWTPVAFATKLPAEFAVAPQTPGEPESGVIRAVLLDKNAEIGQFSPLYPVTLS
ncbi:MAG: hypothetical protein M3384_04375 [Acidobacteriota bacterium]|nr:hypothetical protein [Acidobacteriota bacterium]